MDKIEKELRDKLASEIYQKLILNKRERDSKQHRKIGIHHGSSRQNIINDIADESFEYAKAFIKARKRSDEES